MFIFVFLHCSLSQLIYAVGAGCLWTCLCRCKNGPPKEEYCQKNQTCVGAPFRLSVYSVLCEEYTCGLNTGHLFMSYWRLQQMSRAPLYTCRLLMLQCFSISCCNLEYFQYWSVLFFFFFCFLLPVTLLSAASVAVCLTAILKLYRACFFHTWFDWILSTNPFYQIVFLWQLKM